MDLLAVDISSSLSTVCLKNNTCAIELNKYLAKQIWNLKDRDNLLNSLGFLFLKPSCSEDVCRAFLAVIPEILERCRNLVLLGEDHLQHQWFCIALSKTIVFSSEVKIFAVNYLNKTTPFFETKEDDGEPNSKKAKKSKSKKPKTVDLVEAIYRLVQVIPAQLRHLWDWGLVARYTGSEDTCVKWLALESMSEVVGLAAVQREKMRKSHFSEEEILDLTLQYGATSHRYDQAKMLLNPPQRKDDDKMSSRSHTMKGLNECDLSDNVVSVCGILLKKLESASAIKKDNNNPVLVPHSEGLVSVASTRENLHSLALAAASGRPVLLVGPVGSGKTTLVEHLAMVTGRSKTPHLIKIQLGDQTDSKALLGTYQCSEVPGEFVWKAGSLTRAVTEGHWILLEDLDYAAMDVISVLVPLLESKSLSLPGHGGLIPAHPGFRIFATQRLLSSASGFYQQHSSGSDVLKNLWNKIVVQPLSKDELKQVIVNLHPQLNTVVDRLLEIYFLLSAGKHAQDVDLEMTGSDIADVGKFMSHEGRLISTRDLMKWVKRIAHDFDVSKSTTGNMVFQEALDCFCCCLAKPDKRLPLSEAMAAKLNITKATAEYYLCKYKPHIEITDQQFAVGRASLARTDGASGLRKRTAKFAFTRQSLNLLERVAVCVSQNEPILLVGETGVGKTSSVQYLAEKVGQRLKVINMNQQSDSSDLLGGFKPVDLRFILAPFKDDFELLFCKSFSRKQNLKFLGHLQDAFVKRKWSDLLKLMEHTQKAAAKKYDAESEMKDRWAQIGRRLRNLKKQIKQTTSSLAFTFIEGTLVRALKNGDWVLLDEINLASAETLECLSGLLESTAGSVVLMERGDTDPIVRHGDFRLFACMNPATDVGKKDLPPGLRNRFTEFFVDELEDPHELKILVAEYLKGLSLTPAQIDGIVKFYCVVRNETMRKLCDGTGRRPHYSLRTLCRALRQAAPNPHQNVLRSLYEAFCLSFLTQLDRSSHPIVEQLICQHVVGRGNYKTLLKHSLPEPLKGRYLPFEGFWVAQGSARPEVPEGYVLTPSVRANLRDLTRVVSAGRYPVLIQGETSVGKTSLVSWLARSSGNACVRINNHEHTDLQEYVGCYAADHTGKLLFQEGVLVEAMRKGHWIILDELNLAPTDVLEALNRLLDDNRELFIPETQETVKAHPQFMLFATQNPPGQYGGRKVLSRAFRNRFVELHFDEIPPTELETILHERCHLPMSHCKKLVSIMLELQTHRRSTGVFAGKQGFITLRDLFRWAERYSKASANSTEKFYDWDQLLADNGYMLLAGRVRKSEECEVIVKVIEKNLKRKVDPQNLFSLHEKTSPTVVNILKSVVANSCSGFEHVVWTYSMRRMAVLIGQALAFGEPVLLVGDTGCGKTTVCQIYSALREQQLHSVNCHLHTEGSDFLGGLRPARTHSQTEQESIKLFEWCDGPLVLAMKEGTMFLIDEISLADDSVLERLNSVLEPERTLLLSEKGSGEAALNDVDQVVAEESFRLVATMNPGGDYGKKELSPALRNRFTEIWCPLNQDRDDHILIVEHNLKPLPHMPSWADGSTGLGNAMVDFVTWFKNNEVGKRVVISIRDLLSWVGFINTAGAGLGVGQAYVHGACLVFLDALGSGTSGSAGLSACRASRGACLQFLVSQMKELTGVDLTQALSGLVSEVSAEAGMKSNVTVTESQFGIEPFYIAKGPEKTAGVDNYALDAPTTCVNAVRVLRALQLSKAILLEGSPGVGKTSLVAAIAKAAGHELQRINLSEQTDVSDLFGADLPVEGSEGGRFAWRDGPLLQALKAGHWIVLDELNLASQSVLEGLNACLDHRAEIYVPELGRSFKVEHEKTRLFACQNPLNQGGGRKGLPKSFLNRFTQVYVEPHTKADLQFITGTMYPQLPADVLADMIAFNQMVCEELTEKCSWGQKGSPWEFNLRDIFRWCDLLVQNQSPNAYNPGDYMPLIYADRLRSEADKSAMLQLFTDCFPLKYKLHSFNGEYNITPAHVHIGHSILERTEMSSDETGSGNSGKFALLRGMLPSLQSLMKCLQMNWMSILIGGSASGKTSLVHVLAQLTGNALDVLPMNSAMDTTELLGGFEQADVGRHLEQAADCCGRLLFLTVGQLLVTSAQNTAEHLQALLGVWAQYAHLCRSNIGESLTHQEEVEVMGQKVDKLQKLTQLFSHVNDTFRLNIAGDIETLTDLVQDVASQVNSLKTAKQNGCFEWVDSLLVKALRGGHWLLIDNVNFCSPSVLDRLNALLEPDGVLAVTERGVIDGEVPCVKPHPNFRLILTMDPKYGEISRAMRNRGVEIYLCGEADKVSHTVHDLKTMLHCVGVVGKIPCEILIDLHKSINSATDGKSRYSVVDLLRVASLVESRLQRGVDLASALRQSATEVYARALLDSHSKQIVATVIAETFQEFSLSESEVTGGESGLVECGLWPDGDPSLGAWTCHSVLSSIRKQCALFVHLVNVITQATGSKCKLSFCEMMGEKSVPCNLSSAREAVAFLPFIVKHLVNTASQKSWQLLEKYLQKMLATRLNLEEAHGALGGEAGEAMWFLLKLSYILKKCLKTVCENPAGQEVAQHFKELFTDVPGCEMVEYLPLDLRWSPQLYGHLKMAKHRLYESSSDEPWQEHDDCQTQEAYARCNRLYLLSRLVQCQLLHDYGIQRTEPTAKKLKEGLLSPLQISFALRTGLQIERHKLAHEAMLHLYPFVYTLDTELVALFGRDDCRMTDEEFFQVLANLEWYDRFVWLCHQSMKSQNAEMFGPTLCLHWHWLYEHFLAALMTRFSKELKAVIRQLHSCLGSDQTLSHLHQVLWEAQGHPAPYQSGKVAAEMASLALLYSHLDLTGLGTDSAVGSAAYSRKVALWQHKGERLRRMAVEALLAVHGEQTADEDQVLDRFRESLCKVKGFQEEFDLPSPAALTPSVAHKPMETCATDSKSIQSDPSVVALWPLYDIQAMLSEIAALNTLSDLDQSESSELGCKGDVKAHLGYVMSFGIAQPDALWPLALLCDASSKESARKLRDAAVLSGLSRLTHKQSALHDPQAWLTWQTQPRSEHDLQIMGKKKSQALAFATGASFSEICFSLLIGHYECHKNESKSKVKEMSCDLWSPSNVTLGGMAPKLQQLEAVTHQLIRHVGVRSTCDWSLRQNLFHLACGSLQHLLSSCLSVVDDCQPTIELTDHMLADVFLSFDRQINRFVALDQLVWDFRQSLQGCRDAYEWCRNTAMDEHTATPVDPFENMMAVGCFMAKVGTLQSYLLVPQGPVDPVEKLAVQLDYSQKQLEQTETELHVLNWNYELSCGKALDFTDGTLHPHVRHLANKKTELEEAVEKLSNQTAHRPRPSQYGKLLQECKQYLSTLGCQERVTGMLDKLQQARKELLENGVIRHKTVLAEVESWNATVCQFVGRVEQQYDLYGDITTPFLAGVVQVQVGMKIATCGVLKLLERAAILHSPRQMSPKCSSLMLEECLVRFCSFPFVSKETPNSMRLAEKLAGESGAIVRQVLQQNGGQEVPMRTSGNPTVKLLRTCLLLVKNHALVQGKLDDDVLSTLSQILAQVVATWQMAEEEKKLKELEKESLYKYKEQIHGEELKEDEKDAAEIQQMFPSYDEDFEDIKVGFTLDDKQKAKRVDTKATGDSTDDYLHMQISEDDMVEIQRSHRVVLEALTQSQWKNRAVPQGPDLVSALSYVEPSAAMYQLAYDFAACTRNCLIADVEDKLVGAHVLASAIVQHTAKTEQSSFQKSGHRPYDIYYDPAVSEVVRCRPVLDAFKLRVAELLSEWEDHPTLKELMTLIDRLMSFPVTSPLIKFVTGLEVLVQKAQEWESNAAKYVSLREQLDAVSQLIIDWRKLELEGWRTCLDTVQDKCVRQASKWWFFLYGIVDGHLNPQQSEDEAVQTDEELVKALQQFMEDSPLGEFSTRLELLDAFLCQLLHMQASEKQEMLLNVMWNLHTYYAQFAAGIQQQISKQKSPIEKELRAFVKIARWNDVNFYALKQAVEKTHRTLHKHMKRFRDVLKQPVRPFLVECGSDAEENAHTEEGRARWSGDCGPFLTNITPPANMDALEAMVLALCDQNSPILRLQQITTKYRKHASTIMSRNSLVPLIQDLDEFTGELISTVHELSNLNVSNREDKEKAKTEAKHIHLRKRKALADLFKYLQLLGLSYRKGLLMTQTDSASLVRQPPLDVGASLPSVSPRSGCDHVTAEVWEGCQKYHTRCLARNALLASALVAPSKELGPSNVERCTGFTQHLLELVFEQWAALSRQWTRFLTLRDSLATLGRVCGTQRVYSQGELPQLLENVLPCVNSALEFIVQFEILLQCWPANADNISNMSPVSEYRIARLFLATQEQDLFGETVSRVAEIKRSLLQIKENAASLEVSWFDDEHVSFLEKTSITLKSIAESLSSIESLLVTGIEDSNAFSTGVAFIRSELMKSVEAITRSTCRDETSLETCDWSRETHRNPEQLVKDADQLLTSALLVVQDLLKAQQRRRDRNDDVGGEREESGGEREDETGLQKNHLTDCLLADLRLCSSKYRLDEISCQIQHMNENAALLSSNPRAFRSLQQVLQKLYPVLHQYTNLVQYLITQQVAAFRSSAKLLSVLQGLFLELARKGFCLPADFSDEIAGEGSTQFEDIEGGGLGEGEGVKDVSDQIETEDQLDDARKAGQEKEEKHDDEPEVKDEDNAIEMTDDMDAKLHDLDAADGSENESEDEGDDENELDKQMGDLGDAQTDKLDDQVWGSDNEEDEENAEKKEEEGPGAGQEGPSELAAKQDLEQGGRDEEETPEQQPEEEGGEHINEMDKDQREYDENECDPYSNQDDKKPELPDKMDLSDDLDLDQDMDEKEETDKLDEENPFDIDNVNKEDVEEADDGSESKEEGEIKEKEDGGNGEGEDVEEGNDSEEKEPEEGKEDVGENGEEKDVEENPNSEQKDHRVENKVEDEEGEDESTNKSEDIPQSAELAGKTAHDTQQVQQVEQARDSAGQSENEQKETEGVGKAESREESHASEEMSRVTKGSQSETRQQRRQKPGKSSENRSLGSEEEKIQRRLETVDTTSNQNQEQEKTDQSKQESDLFEHVRDENEKYDVQTMDVANAEQEAKHLDESMEVDDVSDDVMPDDSREDAKDAEDVEQIASSKVKPSSDERKYDKDNKSGEESAQNEPTSMEVEGERVETLGASRGYESSIYTTVENLEFKPGELDIENLRESLEHTLESWREEKQGVGEEEAQSAWQQYEAITSPLAQDLCEQLRLVLEPSQASKLKGDYRTGKRLNMRKVIPYIASQFRKDKIWLRRTKPSKRSYQVMVAVDDSSSMADNHSKQLAFESLATISNALTLLEVGQLAIASFGEHVKVIHEFHEQFSSQSGIKLLQQFTFEQKKTKIAQLLKKMTVLMTEARSKQHSTHHNPETSQLLLIVSDGRGLFLEGMEVVKTAVRQAREANIFLAFVILDSPNNKDSILDIKVPVFKGANQLPEIKPYMDNFPFPFYMLLRDINTLPSTLSDALRQWFELVTATDR